MNEELLLAKHRISTTVRSGRSWEKLHISKRIGKNKKLQCKQINYFKMPLFLTQRVSPLRVLIADPPYSNVLRRRQTGLKTNGNHVTSSHPNPPFSTPPPPAPYTPHLCSPLHCTSFWCCNLFCFVLNWTIQIYITCNL